jgi:hypothetical protein
MPTKIKNNGQGRKKIYIISREEVTLDPGEELEFIGDIEIGD